MTSKGIPWENAWGVVPCSPRNDAPFYGSLIVGHSYGESAASGPVIGTSWRMTGFDPLIFP